MSVFPTLIHEFDFSNFTEVEIWGQTYTVGDTIDNFTLDICENGEGVWEYHEEGTGNIVWMNLFTSW